MSLRAIRLAAILLPAALFLHEVVYGLAGGGLLAAHHYLEALVPLLAALVASLVIAALVLPALGIEGARPGQHAPLALGAALIGIFTVQEVAEATLLGGGASGLAASAAVAWLALPLALALGALASWAIGWLERAGDRLARRSQCPRLAVPAAGPPLATARLVLVAPAPRGLRFGFARRPPPRR